MRSNTPHISSVVIRVFCLCILSVSFIPTSLLYAQEENTGASVRSALEQQRFLEELENSRQSTEGVGNLQASDIYPQQKPKEPTTEAATEAGTCVMEQLVASLAKKGFSKFLDKAASVLVNFNLVPVYVPGLENKEVGTAGGLAPSLDSIGYCMLNSTIQYISEATIKWINSGFDGNPVFVDDPTRIFKDLKEDTLDAFVDSFGNGILCKNFDVDVRLSLVIKERAKNKYNCTYDRAIANLQNEPFSFEVFAEVIQNPMSNRIGAFLTLDAEYLAIKDERNDTLTKELNWGRGYLSWKDKSGKTVTPGTVVEGLTEQYLKLPSERLILADEFDEVLNALIDQLIKVAVQETLGSK